MEEEQGKQELNLRQYQKQFEIITSLIFCVNTGMIGTFASRATFANPALLAQIIS